MAGQQEHPIGWREHTAAMMPVLKRMPRYVRLARAILASRSVDARSRRLLLAGLAYLLSPIDPIPGFIPVIGQLDDLLAALYTIRLALDAMPEEQRERILLGADLTREVVEEDWETTWRATKAIVVETGRTTIRATAWTVSRLAKGAFWVGGKVIGAGGRALSRSRRLP